MNYNNFLLIDYGLPLLGIIITAIAQIYINKSYSKYQQIPIKKRMTGFETARAILDANGLNKVKINKDIIDINLLIEEVIKNTDEKKEAKINWTKVWGKKYPILVTYQKEVNIHKYAKEIRRLFNNLEQEYCYSELDAMLVLKDILGHEYMDNTH